MSNSEFKPRICKGRSRRDTKSDRLTHMVVKAALRQRPHDLPMQRLAVIKGRQEFTLVPWQPDLLKMHGKEIDVSVRDRTITAPSFPVESWCALRWRALYAGASSWNRGQLAWSAKSEAALTTSSNLPSPASKPLRISGQVRARSVTGRPWLGATRRTPSRCICHSKRST